MMSSRKRPPKDPSFMTDKGFGNLDVKFIEQMILTMSEHLIRQGVIDVEGKSIEALRKEIREHLSKETSFIVLYHTKDLLNTARSYHKEQNYEYAFLFYATWFEHWINGLIASAATRRGLEEKEIEKIIRHNDLKGKATQQLKLLGLPPLNSRHLKIMNKITNNRNDFVHYKWQSFDMNKDRENEYKEILIDIEKTITYFHAFERKFVFGKMKKSQLEKAISISK